MATIEVADLVPNDLRRSDEEHRITIAVMGIETERITISIDLSPLESAGIDIDGRTFDEEVTLIDGAELSNWLMREAELRMEFDLGENDVFRG